MSYVRIICHFRVIRLLTLLKNVCQITHNDNKSDEIENVKQKKKTDPYMILFLFYEGSIDLFPFLPILIQM